MTEQNKFNQCILDIFDAASKGLRNCEEELNKYIEHFRADEEYLASQRWCPDGPPRSWNNPATVALTEIDGLMEKAKDSIEKENN